MFYKKQKGRVKLPLPLTIHSGPEDLPGVFLSLRPFKSTFPTPPPFFFVFWKVASTAYFREIREARSGLSSVDTLFLKLEDSRPGRGRWNMVQNSPELQPAG